MRIKSRQKMKMAEGDMTPMIDMTFQLIAFFMVIINFSDIEQDQRVHLPASELAKPPEQAYEEPITIQITDDQTILLSGDEMTIDGLSAALRREAQIVRTYVEKSLSDVTVIIRADRSTPTGLVQEVIQTAQDAEFDTFALRGKQSDVSTLIRQDRN